MSSIHDKTKRICMCCNDTNTFIIILHKTRRQTHGLCIDCAESYINPITGQPNFVLISEHIRDGEYERYEYFVIESESEAKRSDKEILEWQYGEGSVDESGYGDNEFWVHGERLHEIEAQPISLSDALVLERLRIASRNYPYQDLKK